jgi:hypothetical protein
MSIMKKLLVISTASCLVFLTACYCNAKKGVVYSHPKKAKVVKSTKSARKTTKVTKRKK